MTSWNEGYVSDIEYLPGFYSHQTPAHIDTVCLLRNIEPPVPEGEPFRYCELGCGVGETALAIAAANHRSEVWGFDFNPAHIARGREQARAGGLGNIRLEEASFEQLVHTPPAEMPVFDYITLHGVWSWVSAENRSHLVTFIERNLKPGGVAYVTYNAMPGWSQSLPIQRLISTYAAAGQGPSDKRVHDAIAMLRRFADAGSPALQGDHVERLEAEARKRNFSYLAHEYLNAHWQPCFHADVARDLSDAKLDFVGAADLLENFPELSFTPQQRALLDEAPAASRETLKDYFLLRGFRRDVFMRGPRTIPERRRQQQLRRQRLMLAVPPATLHRDIKIPLGEAELNERFYRPALAALAERGSMSVGDMLDLPEAAGSSATEREIIGMLIGSRQAMLATGETGDEPRTVARAYNAHHLASCAAEGRTLTALAAPAVGSAVTVTVFEMLAYEAMVAGTPAEPDALTRAAWALLQQRGDKISFEGTVFETEEENLQKLRENMEKVVAVALPFWRRIGAI